jgi:hypothetical protein
MDCDAFVGRAQRGRNSTRSIFRRSNTTTVPTNFIFDPGGPSQFSVVRAAMHHQFVTPFMDRLFHTGPDQPGIVNSFCIVRNEPWN